MKTEIKGLVFDVGGVLRDSSRALNWSFKKAFEEQKLAFPFSVPETWRLEGFDEFNDFYQINKALLAALRAETRVSELLEKENAVEEMVKTIKKHITQGDEAMLREMEKATYKYFASEESTKKISVFRGVVEGAKLLHSKGFKLAVVSVAKKEMNLKWLKENIGECFDPVLGKDEYTNKVDGIIKCCEAFGLKPSQVAMVGDSITDIINGKQAGCKTIAVLCGMGTKKYLEREQPDYIVNNVSDAAKLLTGGCH